MTNLSKYVKYGIAVALIAATGSIAMAMPAATLKGQAAGAMKTLPTVTLMLKFGCASGSSPKQNTDLIITNIGSGAAPKGTNLLFQFSDHPSMQHSEVTLPRALAHGQREIFKDAVPLPEPAGTVCTATFHKFE